VQKEQFLIPSGLSIQNRFKASGLLMLFALTLILGCDTSAPATSEYETEFSGENEAFAQVGMPFSRSYYLNDGDGISERDIEINVTGGTLNLVVDQLAPSRVRIAVAFIPNSAEDDRTLSISGRDATGAEFELITVTIDSRPVPADLRNISLSILTRDFETKQPTTGDKLHLTHLGADADFEITLVSDGAFSAEIPEGEYAVVFEPAAIRSPVGRIHVSPEHLDDPEHHFIVSGRLVDRNGIETEQSNYSYLVFGADAIPAKLTLHSDFVSFAEVMSDSEFVDRMTTQLKSHTTASQSGPTPDNILIHMDVKRRIVLATMDGEGIRPPTFPPYMESCQGLPASDEALEYHRRFFEHSLSLLNSTQVGGNPYVSVERRVYDHTNVWEVITCHNWNIRVPDRYPNRGFAFHLLDDSMSIDLPGFGYEAFFLFREIETTASHTGIHAYQIYSGKTISNTQSIGHIANKSRSFWALDSETEGSIPNGSVRDGSESGWLPDKPPVPTDIVQYEFDDRFVRVATAFGPWAQYQLNPLTGERGKNVRIAD